ncbi:MAG: DUF2851 family protein [Melioribacteraceae bacterium]|nr:DUF2851 family protein [Melioribacteraceae bacterium]
MSKVKVFESELYKVWTNNTQSQKLKTFSGKDIIVLDSGKFDPNLSGPDFKDVKIRIGNLIYTGDVEIDVKYNDWFSHGHNIDKKYNRVILHLSLYNEKMKSFVYTENGRKINTICLNNCLEEDILTSLQNNICPDKPNSNRLKCSYNNENIGYELKEKFIKSLGIKRFQKKCDRIYGRLKEMSFLKEMHVREPIINYQFPESFHEKKFTEKDFRDKTIWQQLLYELVFEALGYTANKKIMLNLAKSANLYFLQKLGSDDSLIEYIESSLFNIAGLVPDIQNYPKSEISDYTRKLKTDWQLIKRIYDGKTYEETDWHFFKMRPQNFPTIRMAGGARIAKEIIYGKLIERMIGKISNSRNLKDLTNSLKGFFIIKADGYWRKHFIFDDDTTNEIDYFVGTTRADEIVINVVLPFFSVYFDIFGDSQNSKRIFKIYNSYIQKADNKIVRDISQALKFNSNSRRTIYLQGMLELYRSYCSVNKCLECEMGKIVFN